MIATAPAKVVQPWYSETLPTPALSFVGNHTWLGRIFSCIHSVHKIWRWQRDVQFAYHHFQNPVLALSEYAIGTVAKDNALLQTASTVAEIICSIWQAEIHRKKMINTWKELSWQLRNIHSIPFSAHAIAYPNNRFYYYWPKVELIFQLIGQLFYHCYSFSMYLMDISELIRDPTARQRAGYHLLTNIHYIFQQTKESIHALSLASSMESMPVFEYFGITSSHLNLVANQIDLIASSIKNPLNFEKSPY